MGPKHKPLKWLVGTCNSNHQLLSNPTVMTIVTSTWNKLKLLKNGLMAFLDIFLENHQNNKQTWFFSKSEQK